MAETAKNQPRNAGATPQYAPELGYQCRQCMHYWETSATVGVPRCDAYHTQIPVEIWDGLREHYSPAPGDLGIVYTPGGNRPESSWSESVAAAEAPAPEARERTPAPAGR